MLSKHLLSTEFYDKIGVTTICNHTASKPCFFQMKLEFVFVCIFATISFGDSSKDGICQRTNNHYVTYRGQESKLVPRRRRICLNRCFYQTNYQWETVTKINSRTEVRTENFCCPGYKTVRDTPLKCIPNCSPECKNATCVQPGLCECNGGFKPHDIKPNVCVPACEQGCRNGECIDVNQCRCNLGYIMENSISCLPSCREPCVNGECIAPEHCLCFPHYAKTHNTYVCEPTCDFECINGHCTGVNECSCNEGYIKNDTTSNVCDPVCEYCENAFCESPGRCTCFHGYEPSQDPRVCVPICKDGCVNGYCSDPDVCTCDSGFQPSENSSTECIPICSKECKNGKCVAPEVCECFPHYAKTTNEYECKPTCSFECINGECTGVNECSCNEGYTKDNTTTNVCDPVCEYCENSFCESPDLCKCFHGYEHSQNPRVCDPVCKEGCLNGYCSDPDVCTCDSGFQPSENSSTECIPICSKQCNNGECVAPEVCECFSGFTLKSGFCEPVCEDECINSYCAAPDVCECYPDTVKMNETLCFSVCQENATLDCYHVVENMDEFIMRLTGEEMVFLPKDKKALTLHAVCEQFVGMYSEANISSGIPFECSIDRTSDVVHSYCKLTSEKYDTVITTNVTDFNETLPISMNLTLIYPLIGISSGTCELCFCDEFLYLNKDRSFIHLCPCEHAKQSSILWYALIITTSTFGLSIIIYVMFKFGSMKKQNKSLNLVSENSDMEL